MSKVVVLDSVAAVLRVVEFTKDHCYQPVAVRPGSPPTLDGEPVVPLEFLAAAIATIEIGPDDIRIVKMPLERGSLATSAGAPWRDLWYLLRRLGEQESTS